MHSPIHADRPTMGFDRSQMLQVVAVGTVLAASFGLLWPTARTMLELWSASETYKHGFIVVPVFLWLVWRQRAVLATTPVRPWPVALVPAVGMAGLWLFAELANANAPAQLAMVSLVPIGVAAIFGRGWTRVLAFPLAFLFFAVPIGDALVPALMEATADFVVAALRLSGVPVLREGINLVVPSGTWSVVEACSGLRFLIAGIFAGVLYAHFMYRSTARRLAFVAVSIVWPIVANWLRAYGIVMLGHLTDNRLAAGVDHLVYGWVFFAVMLTVMFWIGTLWREDGAEVASPPRSAVVKPGRSLAGLRIVAALFAGTLVIATVARAELIEPAGSLAPLRVVPIVAAGGWAESTAPLSDWRPDLQSPTATTMQTFVRGQEQVGVYVAFFRAQGTAAKLATSQNRIVDSSERSWLRLAQAERIVDLGVERVRVRTASLRSPQQQELVVWQWYWLGQSVTSRDWRAKLDLALDRLLRRGDTGAWVALYAPGPPAEAERVLGAFVADMARELEAALMRTAQP